MGLEVYNIIGSYGMVPVFMAFLALSRQSYSMVCFGLVVVDVVACATDQGLLATGSTLATLVAAGLAQMGMPSLL